MAVLIYPRIPNTLPTGGAVLREPVSSGLVAAFAPGIANGHLTDLVSGLKLGTTGPTYLGTRAGTAGLVSDGSATATVIAPAAVKNFASGAVTLIARMSFLALPGANAHLVGVTANNTGTSPFEAYAFGTDPSGNLQLSYSNGATFRSWGGDNPGNPHPPAIGVPITLVGLYTSSATTIFFGPDEGDTAGLAANPSFSATSLIQLGGAGSNVCIEYALFYNRRLIETELKLFRDNPYHWLRPAASAARQFALGAPPATPVGDGWLLTVDGVDQTARVTACSIQWTLNERTRATVVFNDYLPDRLAHVLIYARDGATKLFGGLILSRHVQGYTQAGPDLKVTCECGDYFAYADWVTVSAAYPETTLKTRLAALVTSYLSAYGITLDGAQVDGPTVAPVTWNQKRVSDALRELSNQTGYFITMSPEKVLTLAPPGDEAAPWEWTDTLPAHVQDADWRDVETVPANKVVLTCGPNGLATIADEHHWGDGSTRIFPLNSPYVAIVGALRTGSDSGGLDPGGFPVGTYGVDDMPWTYDGALNAMRQRVDQPILAANQFIMLWYSAQFPFTVSATTGETPVIEYHVARPDLLSIPSAQQIADELLAQMSGDPTTLHGRFDEDGYQVGQLLTVSLSGMRAIAGTFTIRTITLTLELIDYWRYTLDATEGAIAAPSHLVGWRRIIGEGYAIPGPWETPPAVRSGTGTMTSTIISAGTAAALGGPAFLGGTREGVRTTGTAWEPVSNYIDYYAGISFSAIVRADLSAARAGVTVRARLWNLTQGKSAGESIAVQSTTPVPVVFPVTIEFGNKYRLEKQASGNNEIIHGLGTLEAT